MKFENIKTRHKTSNVCIKNVKKNFKNNFIPSAKT